MDPNRQEKIYVRLLRTWQKECKQSKIGKIPNKDCFMEDLRELILSLRNLSQDSKLDTLKMVYNKTIHNIQYMVSDLLNLRAEKILSATHQLQKINEKLLLDMEKAYYRQLYTAFKGYSKSQKLLVKGILTNGDLHPVKPQEGNLQNQQNSNMHENNQSSSKKTKEVISQVHKTEKKLSSSLDSANPISTTSSSPLGSSTTNSTSVTSSSNNLSSDSSTSRSSVTSSQSKKSQEGLAKSTEGELHYKFLYITHPVEIFVGEDMKIYGPLDLGDLIYVPERNADILLEENFATALQNNYLS